MSSVYDMLPAELKKYFVSDASACVAIDVRSLEFMMHVFEEYIHIMYEVHSCGRSMPPRMKFSDIMYDGDHVVIRFVEPVRAGILTLRPLGPGTSHSKIGDIGNARAIWNYWVDEHYRLVRYSESAHVEPARDEDKNPIYKDGKPWVVPITRIFGSHGVLVEGSEHDGDEKVISMKMRGSNLRDNLIIFASGLGYDKVVEAALSRGGFIVDYKYSLGNTALHYAAKSLCFSRKKRKIRVVELLLSETFDPSVENNAGESPRSIYDDVLMSEKYCLLMMMMTFVGTSVSVETFKRMGDRLDVSMRRISDGKTLRDIAFELEDDALLLLPEFESSGEYSVHIEDGGRRLEDLLDEDSVGDKLFKAIDNGNIKGVERLMDGGADPNIFDARGKTPLMHAITAKNLGILKLLLNNKDKYHVDLELKGQWNLGNESEVYIAEIGTALSYAYELYEGSEGDKPYREAAVALLEAGANPSVKNTDGETLVEEAYSIFNLNMKKEFCWTRLLIKYGADPNFRCGGGTPLIVAIKKGDIDAARFLLNHGANVNVINKYSDTPLLLAIQKKNIEAVRVLLDHGADMNLDDRSAIHLASAWGRPKIVKLLLERGAVIQPSSPSNFGEGAKLPKGVRPDTAPSPENVSRRLNFDDIEVNRGESKQSSDKKKLHPRAARKTAADDQVAKSSSGGGGGKPSGSVSARASPPVGRGLCPQGDLRSPILRFL